MKSLSYYYQEDRFHEFLNYMYKLEDIVRKYRKDIENYSKSMKSEDEYNHTVVTQLYHLDVMIQVMLWECRLQLKGEFSKAVVEKLDNLTQSVRKVNDQWESFRRSFI